MPATRRQSTTNLSDVRAGRLVGVFGLRGELKLDATRIGEDALGPGIAVRATLADGSMRSLTVRSMRLHKGRPLITFDGIDDANAADALVGATLFVARSDVAMAADEYFDEDLIGCALVDAVDGRVLGTVSGVDHFPAQDMLRLGNGAFVPLVREFVRVVDVDAKRIVVALPAGLVEGEAEVDAGR